VEQDTSEHTVANHAQNLGRSSKSYVSINYEEEASVRVMGQSFAGAEAFLDNYNNTKDEDSEEDF
jgi:hypothetical protein